MLRDIPKDLIAFLRYLAPPVVAVVVLWLFDSDHDIVWILSDALQVTRPVANSSSPWPLLALLAVIGVGTFFLHRAVFMIWADKLIHKRLTAKRHGNPSLDELDFSRYHRRVAPADSRERGAQSVLDQANAAVDFFYCCAWNSLIMLLVLRLALWPAFSLSKYRWVALAVTLLSFLIVGLWSHYETSRRDLVAYDKFDGLRKSLLLTMLKDERFPNRWRKFETLQHVIAADDETTRQLLLEIGARASEDGQDLWGLLEYHPLPGPDA